MKILSWLISGIILLSGICTAAELDLEKELNKSVTYDFDGVPVEMVLQKLSSESLLDIIPLKSALGSGDQKNLIFMNVRNMPLGQFIDWLAGALDAKYRIFPDGRVYLSQNYEWVEKNKFGMLFVDLKNVVSGSQEIEELDKAVGEVTKIITLFDDNYYSRIEEQADMVKLVAHIPRELKPIFSEWIETYKKTGEEISSFTINKDEVLSDMADKLSQVREVNYPYLPVNMIIKRIEEDFDINIGCNGFLYNTDELIPEISLNLGRVSLKEVIECVIEKTALKGVEISAPGALWLTEYESDWELSVSRRFLWIDTVVLRSYNIAELNLRIPGDVLVNEICNNIAVRAWLDPLASLVYNRKNHSLIVLADIQVQNRVLAALKGLSYRLGVE